MPQGDYLGMTLTVLDLDNENLAYFQHCADHDFHLQQCADPDCGLIRYPPPLPVHGAQDASSAGSQSMLEVKCTPTERSTTRSSRPFASERPT